MINLLHVFFPRKEINKNNSLTHANIHPDPIGNEDALAHLAQDFFLLTRLQRCSIPFLSFAFSFFLRPACEERRNRRRNEKVRRKERKNNDFSILFNTTERPHEEIMSNTCAKFLLLILSLFVPPLAVWIARNKICSCTVCVNLLLTLLGWVIRSMFFISIRSFLLLCPCFRFQVSFMLGASSAAATI